MNLNTYLDIFQADDDSFNETHNQIRLKFLQDWFTKTSFIFKIETLKEFFNHLNSNVGVDILLSILEDYPEKLLAYMNYQTIPKPVEDRQLLDHNRCLEENTLYAIKEEYVKWFSELTHVTQISVFMRLLKIGGSRIVTKLHNVLSKQHKPESPTKYNEDISIKLQEIIAESSKKDYSLPVNNYSPDEPISKGVANLIQILNKNLKNNASKLDKQIKKIYGIKATKAKDGSKKKNKKSKKSSKASSRKSGKKSKKGKKGKNKHEEVDLLQTLPIWVVINIFSYLDNKTLKKIKSVNSYWAYAVDELKADRKFRKKIDKQIKKSEKTLETMEENYRINWKFINKPEIPSLHLTGKEQRLKRLMTRGALNPKLKPKFVTKLTSTTDDLEFPKISMEVQDLNLKPSCVLDEIRYDNMKHERENLQCPSMQSFPDKM